MPDLRQSLDIDANQLVIVAGVVSLAALVMAGLMFRAVLRSRLALISGSALRRRLSSVRWARCCRW